jgi:hypothetical protein
VTPDGWTCSCGAPVRDVSAPGALRPALAHTDETGHLTYDPRHALPHVTVYRAHRVKIPKPRTA